jgi:hypothetical protein
VVTLFIYTLLYRAMLLKVGNNLSALAQYSTAYVLVLVGESLFAVTLLMQAPPACGGFGLTVVIVGSYFLVRFWRRARLARREGH